MTSPIPNTEGGSVAQASGVLSIQLTITTVNSNDLLYLVIGTNNAQDKISSVADTANLTWKVRSPGAVIQNAGGGNHVVLKVYTAIAPNPLTADTVTISFSTSLTCMASLLAFVSIDTTNPFDMTNMITAVGNGTAPSVGAFTTASAVDVIIGSCVIQGGGANQVKAQSGFTIFTSSAKSPPACNGEYNIVYSAGTFFPSFSTPAGNFWACAGDALRAARQSGLPVHSFPTFTRVIRIRPLQGTSSSAKQANTTWLLDGTSSYKSESGTGIKYQPASYNAQQILAEIAELQPNYLQRYVTGSVDPNFLVPTAAGSAPMTTLEFLQASQNAGAKGCVISPRINLQDYNNTTIANGDVVGQAQTLWNNYGVGSKLNPPMTIVEFDNWGGFQTTNNLTDQQVQTLFDNVYNIGWKTVVVNDAGGYTSALGNSPCVLVEAKLLGNEFAAGGDAAGDNPINVDSNGVFALNDTVLIEQGTPVFETGIVNALGPGGAVPNTITLLNAIKFAHAQSKTLCVDPSVRNTLVNPSQLTSVQGDSSIKSVYEIIDFPGFMQNFIDYYQDGQAASDTRAKVALQIAQNQASQGVTWIYPFLQGFWDPKLFTTLTANEPYWAAGDTLYTVFKNLMNLYNPLPDPTVVKSHARRGSRMGGSRFRSRYATKTT